MINKHLKHCCLISAVFITLAVLFFSNNVLAAGGDDPQNAPESAEQATPVLDVQKSPDDIAEGRAGYHPAGRRVGTPTDVEYDLDNSFPKQGSLLELILMGSETREGCHSDNK